MKNITKFLSLALVAVALSACAGDTCLDRSGYGDVPYEQRTAGDGVVVYGDDCYDSTTTSHSKVRKADPVMHNKARK